jgi:hypothetical protein
MADDDDDDDKMLSTATDMFKLHSFTDFLLCLTNFLGLFLPELLRNYFQGMIMCKTGCDTGNGNTFGRRQTSWATDSFTQ